MPAYILAAPFLFLISILPLKLLYFISDLTFPFVYYIVRYRQKVVRQNLSNSFPEKSVKELRAIEKAFYKYLCDLAMEIFKCSRISKPELMERCRFTNLEVLTKYQEQNRSVIVAMGHMGNWEWAGLSMNLHSSYQLLSVFRPVKNKYFDDWFLRFRSRFGSVLVPLKQVPRYLVQYANTPNILALIADQTPVKETAIWVDFLNQDTAVHPGVEQLAKKMNRPVIYAACRMNGRGRYEITFEELCSNPLETKENEITELHTKKLEGEIKNNPVIWLWSHKRWKHNRK